jgi:hypothetical protein
MVDRSNYRPNRPFRRAVFYFAGFDNIGVQFYYSMFRRGMASVLFRERRRATVSRPAPVADGIELWTIRTEDAEAPVEVDYYFLSPRGLVDTFQARDAFRAIGAWAFTAYAFIRHGIMVEAFRRYWPGALVLTYALLSIPAYFAAGGGAAWLLTSLAVPAAWPLAAGAGVVGGLAAVQLGLRLDRRTFANYLLSAMRLTAAHALGRTRAMDDICESWADFIRNHPDRERWDEALVVGHSTGVTAAVDIVARLREDPQAARLPLSLLTLGSIEGVCCFRGARRQRAALAKLATAPDLVWVDYYSPWDFVSMNGYQTIASAGIDLGGAVQHGPRARMLDFREVMTPEAYRKLRFDIFRRHFQYLSAGDRPSDYCYFGLVSAPRRLA